VRPRQTSRFTLGAVLALLVLGLIEGLAWAITPLAEQSLDTRIWRTPRIFAEQSEMIRRLTDASRPSHLELHPVLGWRYAPDHRDAGQGLNSMALRSNREYAVLPPPGVLRIAAFGDSFVYGNEVINDHAWPALLEAENPHLEVLNYGVGGYGLDQAFLRYLIEGDSLAPHVVLMGFTEDDLRRLVNVYRRFISDREPALFKPRYRLQADGTISLLPNPVADAAAYERYLRDPRAVRELGRHDQWYAPAVFDNPLYDYSALVRLLSVLGTRVHDRHFAAERLWKGGVFNPASEAFRIQVALLEQFADTVRAAGRSPLVVFLPSRASVERSLAGGRLLYEPLAAALRSAGVEYLDAADAFREAVAAGGPHRWFAPGGHYSEEGNRVVAAWLARRLNGRKDELLAQHSPTS
jgi:hypothetical protein